MNSLRRDYWDHVDRAKVQGFTPVPFTWFINFRNKFYAEEGWC